MRLICLSLISLFILAGCASHKDKESAAKSDRKVVTKSAPQKATNGTNNPALPANPRASSVTVTNKNQIITLSDQAVGKIQTVNPVSRFVVLDYGLNPLPAIDQRLNVYRNGIKVGELKVTGPILNNNIAADILAGDVHQNDQARPD